MFDLIFNKDDSFFFEKKLSFSWGAPQENTRNPAIPCQLPDCCHIGAGLGEQCQKLSKILKRLYVDLTAVFVIHFSNVLKISDELNFTRPSRSKAML